MSILNPDNTYTWNGLKVKEYLLTKHNPNKIAMPNRKRVETLGITIHNTEAITVSSNTTPAEQYVRATLNGNMNDVRVHFYCDDYCAWQSLPLDEINWSCADGSGDGNRKTIAIEVIGNSVKAEANAVKLAAYLLNKFNLTVEKNLFTHTHWLNVKDGKIGSIDYLNTLHNSHKNCPIYIIPHWSTFKNEVKKSLENLSKPANKIDETLINNVIYRVRKSWEDSQSQIGAYGSLENAKKICKEGYKVYDENGKEVYSNTIVSDVIVQYRSYVNNKWLNEISNWNEKDDMGYSGIENKSIRGLAIKSSKGKVQYRVHIKGGGWLSWISKYDITDWNTGCAGIKTKDIDAIQMRLIDLKDYKIRYRVSNINSNTMLNWIEDYNEINNMGYAGVLGKAIDKIQIEIVKA